jgi:hypothetical protein
VDTESVVFHDHGFGDAEQTELQARRTRALLSDSILRNQLINGFQLVKSGPPSFAHDHAEVAHHSADLSAEAQGAKVEGATVGLSLMNELRLASQDDCAAARPTSPVSK